MTDSTRTVTPTTEFGRRLGRSRTQFPGEYEVDLIAEDRSRNRAVYDQNVSFTTGASPWIRHDSHVLAARGPHRCRSTERVRHHRGESGHGRCFRSPGSGCPPAIPGSRSPRMNWPIAGRLTGLPAAGELSSERNAFALDVLPRLPKAIASRSSCGSPTRRETIGRTASTFPQ